MFMGKYIVIGLHENWNMIISPIKFIEEYEVVK